MSGTHPTREEDFDLYALGALDGEERAQLESHLTSCAGCMAKLAEAQGRMAMLALTVPQTVPPPGVKERLMRQIATTNRASVGTFTPEMRERSEGIFARWWGLLLPVTGAFALAALLLWLHNGQLEKQIAELRETIQEQASKIQQAHEEAELMSARDTVVVSLALQKNQPEGTARVLYNSRRGMLVYNGHLEPTASDKSYQLWLVPMNGAPISAGVFNPVNGEMNSMMVKVPAGIVAKAFAVTLEPAGGMPAPTGPMILVGPVS